MRFRGITFDLDGTLADTLPVCYAAFRRVFREYLGRDYSDQEIHALFGPSEEGTIRHVIDDWEPALAMYLREYEALHDRCLTPFDGVNSLLDELRLQGTQIAIVTGKGPGSAEITLRRTGLAGHFDLVEAGSPAGPVKPACIRRVLAAWSLSPEVCAHVGDAASDVRSAHEVGVTAIAAAWAKTAKVPELQASHPAMLCRSITALRAWLNQHRQEDDASLQHEDA